MINYFQPVGRWIGKRKFRLERLRGYIAWGNSFILLFLGIRGGLPWWVVISGIAGILCLWWIDPHIYAGETIKATEENPEWIKEWANINAKVDILIEQKKKADPPLTNES